jgi:hypothetical protein
MPSWVEKSAHCLMKNWKQKASMNMKMLKPYSWWNKWGAKSKCKTGIEERLKPHINELNGGELFHHQAPA